MKRSESLKKLMGEYGCDDLDQLLEVSLFDAIAPGICIKCGYTTEVEPDCSNGYCEECGTGTVKSALVLANVI